MELRDKGLKQLIVREKQCVCVCVLVLLERGSVVDRGFFGLEYGGTVVVG